jgi:hypothetical protein
MDASETMYKKALELHHERGDIDGAVELYRKVLEQYPSTEAATLASAQLADINQMSDDDLEDAQARSEPGAIRDVEPDDGPGFGALRLLSVIFKILAAFNLVAGFVTALVATSEPDIGVSGLAAVLGGGFSAIFCWAIAEAIRALLSIEENTRRTVRLLESQRRSASTDT